MTTLEDINITRQLHSRFSAPGNLKAENQAQERLKAAKDNAKSLLQALCTVGLELTHAQSAGVTLPTGDGGAQGIWDVVEGQLASYAGMAVPKDNLLQLVHSSYSVQLLSHPERYYPYIAKLNVPIKEALIVPLHETPLLTYGAFWLFIHDQESQFDLEDVRVLTNMANTVTNDLQKLRFFGSPLGPNT